MPSCESRIATPHPKGFSTPTPSRSLVSARTWSTPESSQSTPHVPDAPRKCDLAEGPLKLPVSFSAMSLIERLDRAKRPEESCSLREPETDPSRPAIDAISPKETEKDRLPEVYEDGPAVAGADREPAVAVLVQSVLKTSEVDRLSLASGSQARGGAVITGGKVASRIPVHIISTLRAKRKRGASGQI